MTTTESDWNPTTRILRTALTGPVSTDDVIRWRDELHATLATIPEGGTFGLLLNLHGFEPVDLEAHKAFRTVVPEILARHGMRPAFIDLFDERPEMEITTTRGIRCVGFANVHHDETKMSRYEERISTNDQRFFTDLAEAETWLEGIV